MSLYDFTFLLIAGSFLGYIDFFSNPKAILNTMYKFLLFFPQFIHYTFMVFIPQLIFVFIPYFILTGIPNFITVTVPAFIKNLTFYFSNAIVHFFASISIMKILNACASAPGVFYVWSTNLISGVGKYLLNASINAIELSYALTLNYLMLFYSNFCTSMFQWLLRVNGYVWYTFEILYHSWEYLSSFF